MNASGFEECLEPDDLVRRGAVAHFGFAASLAAPSAFVNDASVSVDAYVAPADDATPLGGDFADAFRTVDGRIILAIGDVMGFGPDPAAAMVVVRQTMRGVALVHADPSIILLAADRAVRLQYPDRFVSAFIAVIDPVTQRCAYANAGHPAPYLREPDGALRKLFGRNLALGVGTESHFDTQHVALLPGTSVVLYTDGLVASGGDITAGETALEEALRSPSTVDGPHLASRIRAAAAPGRLRDDVAVLAATFSDNMALRRWRFDPQWADAAARVRSELLGAFRACGLSEHVTLDAEVVLSELFGNAMRYAPGTIELVLDPRGGDVVVHLLDAGPGFYFHPRLPHDLYSECGRGLYLISRLAAEFTVERRFDGGSHARVVFPGASRAKGLSR